MPAILIQRCANGLLAAPANSTDVSKVHSFPDSVTSDSAQAIAFVQWLDTESRRVEPPPVNVPQELRAVSQVMQDPAGPVSA